MAQRLRQVRRAQRAHSESTAGTARELVIVAFAVPLATLLLLAVIVAVTLLASGGGFGTFGTALGSAWLSVHQVPLSIGGVSIGALPLLPTIALVVAVFVYTGPSARLRVTPADLAALVGAAIGGPLLVTALALALVLDGSSVLPVNPPNALVAFGTTALIYGGGTLAGIARRDWRDWCAAIGLDGDRLDDVLAGVRTGWIAVLMLVGAGAVAVCALLVVRWPAVSSVVAGGNRLDGYLGLVLVSVLYLPNVFVDAAAALLGAPVQMGGALVDVFNPRPGTVPGLPVLAIAPGAPPIRFLWALVLAVPLVVAIWAGLRMRHVDPLRNLRRVAISAATAAAVLALAAFFAGGAVGELGRAGADAPLVALFAFGWLAVVGAIVALLHAASDETKAQRRAAAAEQVPVVPDDDAPVVDSLDTEAPDASDPVDGGPPATRGNPAVGSAPPPPTPVFFRPDDDAPVVVDLEDLMYVEDVGPD